MPHPIHAAAFPLPTFSAPDGLSVPEALPPGTRTRSFPRDIGRALSRLRRTLPSLLEARAFPACGAITAGLCLWAIPAAAAIVLNEIYYDPPGADAGYEWVELYNTGPWAASLEGLALEAGNGSAPDQWSLEWTGSSGHWIEAGGTFVIGGPFEGRPPDASCLLHLQNGPDGARLRLDDLVLDLVGWGPLEFPCYFEGSPGPAVRSGLSLARRRDGLDTGDNQADFEGATPTPGRRNRPEVDLQVRIARPGRPFPLPVGRGEFLAHLTLRNLGLETLHPGEIRLEVDGSLVPLEEILGQGIPPAGEAEIPLFLTAGDGAGIREWMARARADRDEAPENDQDTLRLWSGPSPLLVSELLQKPLPGGSEWIELTAVGEEGLALAGWCVEESGGSRARMTGGVLESGRACLLAQDPASRSWPAPEALVPWEGSWPRLNDTAGESGAADSIFLLDPQGFIRDWAAIPPGEADRTWVRAGPRTAESVEAAWVRGGEDGGSPGVPEWPRPEAALSTGESTAPPAFSLRRDGAGVWLRLEPDLFPGAWEASVWNLHGRRVWRAGGKEADRLPVWRRWDGRDPEGRVCPAGLYVLEVRAEQEQGGSVVERSGLVLGR